MKQISYCVLIRTYNSEKYIINALKSAAMQTHPTELIVVTDDQSKDNTKNIIQKFKDENPNLNIKLLDNEYPRGPDHNFLNALNYIKNQQIEYIAVLDSDDVWHPHKQELQLRDLILNDSKVAFCNNDIINSNGEFIAINDHYQNQFFIDKFISNSFFCFSSLIFPTKYVNLFELDDKVCDMKLVINLHRAGLKFSGLDRPLLSYRRHGANDSRNKLLMSVQRFRLLWKLNKFLSFKRFIIYAFSKLTR